MQITAFCHVTSCCQVYRRFGGTRPSNGHRFLALLGLFVLLAVFKALIWAGCRSTSIPFPALGLIFCPEDGGRPFVKKSVNINQPTRRHIPGDSDLHIYLSENLKPLSRWTYDRLVWLKPRGHTERCPKSLVPHSGPANHIIHWKSVCRFFMHSGSCAVCPVLFLCKQHRSSMGGNRIMCYIKQQDTSGNLTG
jgi:hypothetical protein